MLTMIYLKCHIVFNYSTMEEAKSRLSLVNSLPKLGIQAKTEHDMTQSPPTR